MTEIRRSNVSGYPKINMSGIQTPVLKLIWLTYPLVNDSSIRSSTRCGTLGSVVVALISTCVWWLVHFMRLVLYRIIQLKLRWCANWCATIRFMECIERLCNANADILSVRGLFISSLFSSWRMCALWAMPMLRWIRPIARPGSQASTMRCAQSSAKNKNK